MFLYFVLILRMRIENLTNNKVLGGKNSRKPSGNKSSHETNIPKYLDFVKNFRLKTNNKHICIKPATNKGNVRFHLKSIKYN